MKEYKVSVIIPVYNVEDYLREAIDSITDQSIGFEENIQLILVNDGSSDASGKICEEYQNRYPENVLYIDKKGEGVSATRNRGLDEAKGEYITFLDGDDIWDREAFKNIMDFFEEHSAEVDVVAARVRFFEAQTNFHPLDYKFRGGRPITRVVDLRDEDEYDSVQSTAVTVFYKRKAIGDLRFDTRLSFGEDSVFVNQIILKKQAYGLAGEALYYYRKREGANSAVNSQIEDVRYYTDSLEYYHKVLQERSIELFGRVIPYIQYVNYYDLSYRFSKDVDRILTPEVKEQFMENLKALLQNIDDRVMFHNRRSARFTIRKTAYRLKHGHDLMEDVFVDEENKALTTAETEVLNFKNGNVMVRLVFFRKIEKVYHLEGMVSKDLLAVPGTDAKLYFAVGGKKYPVKITGENRHYHYKTLLGDVYFANNFSVDIPVGIFKKRESQIKCKVEYNGRLYVISFALSVFLPSGINSRYVTKMYGSNLMRFYKRKITVIHPRKHTVRIKYVLLDHQHQRWLRKKGHKDVARLRRKYYWRRIKLLLSRKKKEEIWILSDRVMNAGDNGEVLFKYLNRIKPEGVRPIFAISREAECVPRLQSEGEVVFFEDEQYKILFLQATKIISSGASEFTLNPFGPDRKHLVDLFHYDFYYLQHGVACADLSDWLGRYKKNINMLFASSEKERNAFINGGYDYDGSRVKLTGQARFDDLYDDRQKEILILPTWRKAIKESYDRNTTSVYFDKFKETEYFKFYNSLINHPRLLQKMREKGYHGKFCLHPIHEKQWVDFEGNDVFAINEGYVNYNDEFARAAVTVTDYSSVIFDFAYLRKTIIYAQFDKEEFFKEQTYDEGYFSYEEDGFGPVCRNLEEVVDKLVEAIDADCQVPREYLDRMNRFFAYSDKNNCERITKQILLEDRSKTS